MMKFKLVFFALLIGMGAAAAAPETRQIISADGVPWMIFAEGKKIVLQADPQLRDKEIELVDEVGDSHYRGRVPADGALCFDALPCGYYRIKCDGLIRRMDAFGVVPDPQKRLPARPDTPYAMNLYYSNPGQIDVAFNNDLARSVPALLDFLKLVNVTKIREQLKVPFNGENFSAFDDEAGHRRRFMPKALAAGGLYICDFFATNACDGRDGRTLPTSLLRSYRMAERYAQGLAPAVKLWEFWNEPDDSAWGREAAWDFAALNKAAMLGFRAGAKNVAVTNGSVFSPMPNPFYTLVIRNEIAPYQDYFNIHVYSPVEQYASQIQSWETILAANQGKNLPLIITENGTKAEGLAQAPTPITWGGPDIHVFNHTIDQEQKIADFVVASQILMQSLGVKQNYFFMLRPCYEENGQKDWSLLRYDCSSKPGVVAWAVLMAELGPAEYLGKLAAADGVEAFLYRLADGAQIVAFRGQGTLAIPAEQSATLTSMYGKKRSVAPTGGKIAVAAAAEFQYLGNLRGLAAVPQNKPGAFIPEKFEKRVIFNLHPVGSALALMASRSELFWDGANPDNRVRVEVVNLSNEEKEFDVIVSGGTLKGLPPKLKLAPMSETFFDAGLTMDNAGGTLEIWGVMPDNIHTTKLVVPVVSPRDYTPWTRAMNPASWKENSSGTMKCVFDAQEQCLRFDVDFTAPALVKDQWVYPALKVDTDELKGVLSLSFEVKCSTAAKKGIVMVCQDPKKVEFQRYQPLKNEWVKVNVSLAGIKPETLDMIKIGISDPDDGRLSYFVRNIRIGR